MRKASIIQLKEQRKFLIEKQKQMFGCVNKNQDVIKMIPNSLVSHSLKKDFIKSRGELMKRSFITESQNKMIREWTLPRMLLIAQEEERNEKEMKK